jgi:hypothetical protein
MTTLEIILSITTALLLICCIVMCRSITRVEKNLDAIEKSFIDAQDATTEIINYIYKMNIGIPEKGAITSACLKYLKSKKLESYDTKRKN